MTDHTDLIRELREDGTSNVLADIIEALEADNAALRRLLLRWLQIINRAKREAATVAEWDKLRQETDAALAGKEKT